MLCAADVILGEIREEAELKREACNAVANAIACFAYSNS